jgi:hypothetical protein
MRKPYDTSEPLSMRNPNARSEPFARRSPRSMSEAEVPEETVMRERAEVREKTMLDERSEIDALVDTALEPPRFYAVVSISGHVGIMRVIASDLEEAKQKTVEHVYSKDPFAMVHAFFTDAPEHYDAHVWTRTI